MKQDQLVRRIEIRDRQGRLVVLFEEPSEEEQGTASVPGTQPKPAEPSAEGAPTNGAPSMTDAQRRYLFRILAGRGLNGDEAHARLKTLFGVESLDAVTKPEATRAIDRLLADGSVEASSHGTSQR